MMINFSNLLQYVVTMLYFPFSAAVLYRASGRIQDDCHSIYVGSRFLGGGCGEMNELFNQMFVSPHAIESA